MARSIVFMALLSLVLLIQYIDAPNDFVVEATTCNKWNERSRLQVGDTIVYMYEADKSLVVTKMQEDYIICNAPSPVDPTKSDDHGYSVVKLNQTGPHYFISGMVEINNDKIIILIIADKRLTTSTPASTSTPTSLYASPSFLNYYLVYFICVESIVLLVLLIFIGNEENELARFFRLMRILATGI
ncbi:early nodulin-like protein 1 [Tanacetum coccineum]